MFRKVHDVEIPTLRDGTIKLKKKGSVCILKLSGKLDIKQTSQDAIPLGWHLEV